MVYRYIPSILVTRALLVPCLSANGRHDCWRSQTQIMEICHRMRKHAICGAQEFCSVLFWKRNCGTYAITPWVFHYHAKNVSPSGTFPFSPPLLICYLFAHFHFNRKCTRVRTGVKKTRSRNNYVHKLVSIFASAVCYCYWLSWMLKWHRCTTITFPPNHPPLPFSSLF